MDAATARVSQKVHSLQPVGELRKTFSHIPELDGVRGIAVGVGAACAYMAERRVVARRHAFDEQRLAWRRPVFCT